MQSSGINMAARAGRSCGTALALVLALAACTTPEPGLSSLETKQDSLVADKSVGAFVRVGDAMLAAGDFSSAVTAYRHAAQLDPRDPVPLARLGTALASAHAYTEAADAYRQALALAPKDPGIHRGLGSVLLAVGKPAVALTHLEAARAKGEEPSLLNAIGVADDLLGRHEEAQKSYRAGLRLSPGHVGIRNNLGLSQALAGDYKAAIATLSELVKSPAATPRQRQNLALAYGLAGDSDHAAAIARLDLGEAEVKNNLAYYELLRGLDDKARAAAILAAQHNRPAGVIEPTAKLAAATAPEASKPELVAKVERSAPVVATPVSPPAAAKAAPVALVPNPHPAKADAPEVSEREPASADPAPVKPEPVVSAADETPPPSPKRPAHHVPSGPPYAVQAGAFRIEGSAEKVRDQLVAKGYEFSITHNPGGKLFLVRSSALDSKAAAADLVRKVEAEHLAAIIVPLGIAPAPKQAADAE